MSQGKLIREVCRKCGGWRDRWRNEKARGGIKESNDPNCVHKFEEESDKPKGYMSHEEADRFRGRPWK